MDLELQVLARQTDRHSPTIQHQLLAQTPMKGAVTKTFYLLATLF